VAFFSEFTRQRPLTACLSACLLSTACSNPSAEDETNSADESTSANNETTSESGDDGPVVICEPDKTRCADPDTLEICAATGLEWESFPCKDFEECNDCFDNENGGCVAACVGPCDLIADQPSSEGCSFFTTGMYQSLQPNQDYSDAVIVGNPSPDLTAHVDLYFVPAGSNLEGLVESIELLPLQSDKFVLPAELTDYDLETSLFRSGKVHHVVSDIPIVAYLHSPYEASSTNGSSMLLPEQVMGNNYVVYSHLSYTTPSYFVIIALENQTTVTWRPTRETAGDYLPLPFVGMGETGEQLLNRFDNMRILTSKLNMPPICESDLSGTVIESDKPIWVLSATRGARIPFCDEAMPVAGCPQDVNPDCHAGSDFLQEQNIPLELWGREYVGPHSPLRASEQHYWRIYAGEEDVDVTVEPASLMIDLPPMNKGEFQDLLVPNGTNLYFTSDKVFMPVQYLSGDYDAGGIGSPAMVQMVPTAQFLDNYVFVTGTSYESNFVQVMREAGSADVILDGQSISGWAPIQGWEVTTVSISEGAHQIESADQFGILQYGWTSKPNFSVTAAYAYPGGMKAEQIFLP
jgi:hypothetical protein